MLSGVHYFYHIRGLSKMGYRWNELSPALQNSLMRNIKRIENEMNYLDSSILVLSLGTLRGTTASKFAMIVITVNPTTSLYSSPAGHSPERFYGICIRLYRENALRDSRSGVLERDLGSFTKRSLLGWTAFQGSMGDKRCTTAAW